jgi:molybdopterin synthase catalytic subunit
VSGRVALARIQPQPLDPGECLAAVTDPSCGGLALFAGVVRDEDGGRVVTALSYEAHPTAVTELARVCAEIAELDEVHAVAAVHRVGDLAIGDLAVVVAVSAPHRAEALRACHRLIDQLKHEVPIWKHQVFADGTAEWVGAGAC